MYSELMCAADGYEQVVLDEDKGQCEVVKYVQTPTAPPEPSPTEPFLQYKTYHNLADMLMNIMKNEKRNQNTTRILYEVFNEANWIKFINGTKQYHYNLQDNTLKTIGYKYKGSTDQVVADQIVEVKSPREFFETYTQNLKDNNINKDQYAKAMLGLYLYNVILHSGITYYYTHRNANGMKVDVVPPGGQDYLNITLGQCLNLVFEIIKDIVNS
ncbi:hypothetical protein, partial [Bacteroides acidifaciens]|uniref:hypothetical protein n=1 Tax=Bacteroides acidifaciens TaxID=85831 RepID=UPI0025A5C82C